MPGNVRNSRLRRLASLLAGVLYVVVVSSVYLAHTCAFHREGDASATGGYVGTSSDDKRSENHRAHSDDNCPACRFLESNRSPAISSVPFIYEIEAASSFPMREAAVAGEYTLGTFRNRAPPSNPR